MKKRHDRGPKRVGEPVQVYLAPPERAQLVRLEERLAASKSDVVRQALAALEREVTNPKNDPILALIGIADHIEAPDVGYDVAVEHDRFLAESEVASWSAPSSAKRKRRAR